MSRRRHLSEEDEAVWKGFARSITPLRPSRKSAVPATDPPARLSVKPARAAKAVPLPPMSPLGLRDTSHAKSSPLAPLGPRWKRRVARGGEAIDARIDLHGMTQNEAHAALLRFLRNAQAEGARTVLVVTGKGSSGRDAAGGRGVLKRQVPMWLALPEFRVMIVGFEDAGAGHGGQGALYVRLRRAR
ncbi:MAG TPA: Smr/MutS family protein [Xanthobacteraceae bacterium]|nr:Smr/MutS family protein [Xanthobacteraceae bacterium]